MANAPVIGPVDLEFEVPDLLDTPRPVRIATWLFAPADGRPVSRLVVCLPGGTYDKRYFHLEVPGRDGYSMAAYLAARGSAVLAVDHLGVGGSTHPDDPAVVTPALVGAVNHAVSVQARARFAAGALHPALNPVAEPALVGVGHSMGAMLALLQQAEHRSFDRLAVLGKSTASIPPAERVARADAVALTVVDGYAHPDRRPELFYWDDVPDDVIRADRAGELPVPAALAAGTFASDDIARAASMVDVPVFVAAGERDTIADVRQEPAAYAACDDVTAFLLRGSGHGHNLASTRERLWSRLAEWIAGSGSGDRVAREP